MDLMNMKMRKQIGFTLLEVMVTMVIIGFGLLGIAGIIANGLKNNHSTYSRSQASWLANDIADRMRANVNKAASYTLALAATTPTAVATVADRDIIAWRTALAATLQSGTGSINLDTTTQKLTVIVQWDDSRAKGGNSAEQFKIETVL